MQVIDKTDVLNAAKALIDTDGFTTTLDVKRELRAQSLWALQRDVSSLMEELYEDGTLEFDDLGTHRSYRLVAGQSGSPTQSVGRATTKSSNLAQAFVPPTTPIASLVIATPTPGCWECRANPRANCTTVLYVSPAVHSRSRARWIFHVEAGISYNDARARKR